MNGGTNKFTLFTPTYNRSQMLKRIYFDLLKQNNKDFIWLIVDDGSTDNTETLVKQFINDDLINIKYIKKMNGGKHTCYNEALKHINTEYFLFSLDSDDTLSDMNCINKIQTILDEHPGYNAYSFLHNLNISQKLDLSALKDKTLAEATALELTNNIDGIIYLFKTDCAKKYKFPEFNNEKIVTENFIFYQMDTKVYWTNIVIENGEYQNDGLTKNRYKAYLSSPNGWYQYNLLRTTKTKVFKTKVKSIIHSVCFGTLAHKNVLMDQRYKLATALLYPLGLLENLYIKIKNKYEKRK